MKKNLITNLAEKKLSADILGAIGLDWEVKAEDISVNSSVIDGYKAIVRQDNNRVLSVMGDRYQTIQNQEALNFFDSIVETNDAIYSGGGLFKEGAKVYITAELPAQSFVDTRSDDMMQRKILIASSHDGSLPLLVKFFTHRIVCSNTFNAALRQKTNKVSVRHTKNHDFKVKEAQKVLGLAVGFFDDLKGLLSIMDKTPITTDEVAKTAGKLFGEESTRAQNNIDQVVSLFTNGRGNYGVTRYDALNAFTDFYSNSRATRKSNGVSEAEQREESLLFGSGALGIQRAFDLLAV